MDSKDDKKKSSVKISSKIIELLSKFEEIELEDVVIEAGDLEITLQPKGAPSTAAGRTSPTAKPSQIIEADFSPPIKNYPGKIVEVCIGNTKKEGGSRAGTVVIGGESSPPLCLFEGKMPHLPVFSLDVFDSPIPLARAVKMHFNDVMDDPAEWAKRCVKRFDAEMVNLHLTSIDPLSKDTSPKEAAKTVENVLQAVDVPLTVGGCGDPEKDLQVFTRVAEVTKGERILFNSVTLDMDVHKTAEIIKQHGHAIIAFTSMDMNRARELNRKLYDVLPRENIIIDTTTAALGYGLDYAFSIMERTRLAALQGDSELQHPMASGTTNAWAAREAWMAMAPEWGPRELRGPIWETVTALTMLLAGVDYFMMMHPAAVKTVKTIVKELTSDSKDSPLTGDWLTARFDG